MHHAMCMMRCGAVWCVAAFSVHGPQQVFRLEAIACGIASGMAREGGEIVLDYQVVVKATPIQSKGTVKDEDYRDVGNHNVMSKHLAVRWTPGHQELHQASTCQDYN